MSSPPWLSPTAASGISCYLLAYVKRLWFPGVTFPPKHHRSLHTRWRCSSFPFPLNDECSTYVRPSFVRYLLTRCEHTQLQPLPLMAPVIFDGATPFSFDYQFCISSYHSTQAPWRRTGPMVGLGSGRMYSRADT